MNKRIATPVVLVVAIIAIIYAGIKFTKQQRGRAGRRHAREEFTKAQCCREIICDACDERSTGMVLNRAQVGRYQECPKCHEKAGRPIVYRFCQDPDCNRQLIKGANTVITEDGRSSAGDEFVCPNCGSAQHVYRDILKLDEAQRIAEQTGQELP